MRKRVIGLALVVAGTTGVFGQTLPAEKTNARGWTLRPDGLVDAATFLSRGEQGLKREENAAVNLLRAVGPWTFNPISEGREPIPFEVYSALGMEAGERDDHIFILLRQFAAAELPKDRDERRKVLEKWGEAEQRPWGPEEFPKVAEWIKANEACMAAVGKATAKAHLFLHRKSFGDPSALLWQDFQRLSEPFAARTMLRAKFGEKEKAVADLVVIHKLGWLMGQVPNLLWRSRAISLQLRAKELARQGAEGGAWTITQAKKIMDQLDSMPQVGSMAVLMDTALRVEEQEQLESQRQQLKEGQDWWLALDFTKKEREQIRDKLNWKEPQAELEKLFDRWAEIEKSEPLPWKRLDAYAAMEKEARRVTQRDFPKNVLLPKAGEEDAVDAKEDETAEEFSRRASAMLLKSAYRELRKLIWDMQISMRRQLQDVALALAAYRETKGHYPERLADLSPQFLENVPVDVFTGEALHYRLRGDGQTGFEVYSVGPNRIDEDGRSGFLNTDADDLSIIGGTQEEQRP